MLPGQDKVYQWNQRILDGSIQEHCIQLWEKLISADKTVNLETFYKESIAYYLLQVFPSFQSHRNQHCPHSR